MTTTTSGEIDVIIPCYNAGQTLARAIGSVLHQPALHQIIVVDDASSDDTVAVVERLAAAAHGKIQLHRLPQNGGVARARNWGLLNSSAEMVAFLDADDAYEAQVLTLIQAIMRFRPDIPMLRLALKPMNIDPRYRNHPDFAVGWRHVEMTVGGNMVFRRDFLLACGGFPQDELFRRFGGEDVALSLAVLRTAVMGTAFEHVGMGEIAVLHYCRPNMHAYRLLDTALFGMTAHNNITAAHHQQANAVTARIVARLHALPQYLAISQPGKLPLQVECQ